MAGLHAGLAAGLLSVLFAFPTGPAHAANWKRLDSDHMTTYAQLREAKSCSGSCRCSNDIALVTLEPMKP